MGKGLGGCQSAICAVGGGRGDLCDGVDAVVAEVLIEPLLELLDICGVPVAAGLESIGWEDLRT